MASGCATSGAFEDAHFDEKRAGDTAIYVDVRLDTLIDPLADKILERQELEAGHLAEVHWDTQMSGIHVPTEAAAQLETDWAAFLSQHGQEPVVLAEEVTTPAQFFEGATRQVTVNIYERCPHARQQCIEHFGCRCSVCGFDFEAVFGELGRGFIHVHHLKPLAEIRAEYEIDPIMDLRPICPNCHAMIHRNAEVMTIENLKRRILRSNPSA
jgi:5-methylcytosine-specific restriction protein A